MKKFERLGEFVAHGDLRIIHIEAVPRSISTALSRSLNEAGGPSIYINEPFNRMKHDIDAAAGHVLDAAIPLMDETDECLTVVAKNMARNLSPEIFRRWTSLAEGVVWSIRDPRIQIGSLLTRIANDIIIEPGADKITQNTLGPYMQQASDFLENSGISKGYSKTSWAEIGEHYRSGFASEKSVVIDGGRFLDDPARVLGRACLALDLEYRQQMIEGWEQGYVNANDGYSNNLDITENGWTKHAASSRGVESAFREPLDPSVLPGSLRRHILDVAIPIYEEMMEAGL